MKSRSIILLIIFVCSFNFIKAQIGWYLKVNGTLWNQSATIPNNAKLIFGVKEGANLTPCYNLTTTKLTHGGIVLANPTGLKNPWNIDLATVLNGKTGTVTLEIKGTGCSNTNNQHWIVNFIAGQSTSTTSTSISTTTTTATSISSSSGTTATASISKTAPRSQHIVAKVRFTNNTATVTKVCFTTGYPVTNAYQTVTNLKINNGVVKTISTGSKYLEFTYANLAKGASVDAIYEYDITTYAIDMNTTKALSKAYVSNTDYVNFTRSVPTQTDLSNTKLKSICDNLWAQSGGNYMTYAQKVTDWMTTNTEWQFTGGIVPSNTFFNSFAGTKCKGDCGSLSNAMVAMLRYKGMPARLLVGYGSEKMTATDYKGHAWMEFYIQDFGWIPVDPSYRSNSKIVIGKIPHKGIIVTYDAFYNVVMLGSTFKDMFIQSYLWALNGTAPSGSYALNFTVASTNFVE